MGPSPRSEHNAREWEETSRPPSYGRAETGYDPVSWVAHGTHGGYAIGEVPFMTCTCTAPCDDQGSKRRRSRLEYPRSARPDPQIRHRTKCALSPSRRRRGRIRSCPRRWKASAIFTNKLWNIALHPDEGRRDTGCPLPSFQDASRTGGSSRGLAEATVSRDEEARGIWNSPRRAKSPCLPGTTSPTGIRDRQGGGLRHVLEDTSRAVASSSCRVRDGIAWKQAGFPGDLIVAPWPEAEGGTVGWRSLRSWSLVGDQVVCAPSRGSRRPRRRPSQWSPGPLAALVQREPGRVQALVRGLRSGLSMRRRRAGPCSWAMPHRSRWIAPRLNVGGWEKKKSRQGAGAARGLSRLDVGLSSRMRISPPKPRRRSATTWRPSRMRPARIGAIEERMGRCRLKTSERRRIGADAARSDRKRPSPGIGVPPPSPFISEFGFEKRRSSPFPERLAEHSAQRISVLERKRSPRSSGCIQTLTKISMGRGLCVRMFERRFWAGRRTRTHICALFIKDGRDRSVR